MSDISEETRQKVAKALKFAQPIGSTDAPELLAIQVDAVIAVLLASGEVVASTEIANLKARLKAAEEALQNIPRMSEYQDENKFWYDFNVWTAQKLNALRACDLSKPWPEKITGNITATSLKEAE